ncbi:MAG: TMEM175 family protein [Devosia sp.]
MENSKPSEPKGTARLEALSDGIFAIGMTLLVLDIHVPESGADASLTEALLANWPNYLAFLVGFFTLLVCWINHHYMFEFIRKGDGVTLLLNGFKMLVVSFTPFATALFSRYFNTDNQQIAVSVYTGNFFMMGLSMTALWVYSQAKGFTVAATNRELLLVTRLYILASVLAGAIFALSFLSVWASLALFVVMFGIFVFPRGLIRHVMQLEDHEMSVEELAPPAE